MERELIELTIKDLDQLLWPNKKLPILYKIVQDEVVDRDREKNYEWHDITIQRLSDGKFFNSEWETDGDGSIYIEGYPYKKGEWNEVFKKETVVSNIVISYE